MTDTFGGDTRAVWLVAIIQVVGAANTTDVTVTNEFNVFVAAMAGADVRPIATAV